MQLSFLLGLSAILLAADKTSASCGIDHTVVEGDFSFKIVKKICGGSTGCQTGVKSYPTLISTNGTTGETEYCSDLIWVGDVVKVCCEESDCNFDSSDESVDTPTDAPVDIPTDAPTDSPTDAPTDSPTDAPTDSPTDAPTDAPTDSPTDAPTDAPTSGTQRCDSSRTVKEGDTVYFTIDDGPSFFSRPLLLEAIKDTDVKLSFFESGYNVCPDAGDSGKTSCATWAYDANVQLLANTVKAGHFVAAHSDFHYYDAAKDICSYLTHETYVRPAAREQECGNDPIQDMVQGAHQLEEALRSTKITWTDEEAVLRDQAIETIWTYARLPCSDIWRTSSINETNLPGVTDAAEISLRASIADDMFSGNVKCRPQQYSNVPWKLYGFDSNTEWKAATLTNEGELCRYVKVLEDGFEAETDPLMQGRMMMLTHDYHFDTQTKAELFRDVVLEMKAKGYKLDTVDNWK